MTESAGLDQGENGPLRSESSLEISRFGLELFGDFDGKLSRLREEVAISREALDTEEEKLDYERRNMELSFDEYGVLAGVQPNVVCTAFQRLYNTILHFGVELKRDGGDEITGVHYKIFDDPLDKGKDAIYGLDESLERLVNQIKSAALGYGVEKRLLLLVGPVGSAKSSILRLFKKGLEHYTALDEGALFTLGFLNPHETAESGEEVIEWCPMNEEPLRAVPKNRRAEFLEGNHEETTEEQNEGAGKYALEKIEFEAEISGDLCPHCQHYFDEARKENGGSVADTLKDIRVKRVVFDEKTRTGIGTFQPKDEKNQDSTELTGDLNYRKIAKYGSDSDPRAFNFDGEFQKANRGIFECIEVLKLETAFLYEFLGATQEHKIKPKKFPLTDIDEVIIGHTNEPEYRRLQANEFMEALRDRTVKVDIPYVTKLDEEVKIYEKDYNSRNIKGKHLAPHTIEIAAMWAVLTRLVDPKDGNLSRLQKLKLYNGQTVEKYTEENVKDLKKEAHEENEGKKGISPRYIQDKISNALVNHPEATSVNPFMVMIELRDGLKHHSLISNPDERKEYEGLLQVVETEYEEIVKNEVQEAIACDHDSLAKLCGNYIDNIKAYTQKEKVKNPFTGQFDKPDERLMKSIEEKIDIPESRKDDFRREIMNYIGALAIDNKEFKFDSNERLYRALRKKLFEDQKDTIKLTSLVSHTVDKSAQEKIDVVKARLIRDYGYNEESATDVLNYVASIFARGDVKDAS